MSALAPLMEELLRLVVMAYIVPTNAMAPTLVGPHFIGECPHCRRVLMVPHDPTLPPFLIEQQKKEGELGICTHCWQTSKVTNWRPNVQTADRFLCVKFLKPRRWDVVVFRYPPKPEEKYVKRLIGLPKEEVVIKENAIWINGKKMPPPAKLAKLPFTWKTQYSREEDEENAWGSPKNPVRLGAQDYYVLGDFALRSSDSRSWKAVPATNLEGVAVLIYWPPSRWRFLR